jgi:hypothetical protein
MQKSLVMASSDTLELAVMVVLTTCCLCLQMVEEAWVARFRRTHCRSVGYNSKALGRLHIVVDGNLWVEVGAVGDLQVQADRECQIVLSI